MGRVQKHTLVFVVHSGPAREARLWGSSISHWRLLPRERAAQSHLHYVSVSAWSAASWCGVSLADASGLTGKLSIRGTSPRSWTQPSRPGAGAQTAAGRDWAVASTDKHGRQNETLITITRGSLPSLCHSGAGSQSLPITSAGLRDFHEEATFIPPTKRQTDKAARSKPKEKKENCKQQ